MKEKIAAVTVLFCSIRVIRKIRGYKNEQPRILRMTRMKGVTMAAGYEAESYAVFGCILFFARFFTFAALR